MLDVTDENFSEVIKNSTLTIIDFWAPWCGPCRMLSPVFEQVAADMGTRAVFGKVNIDDNPDAASKCGVRSIPTLIMFRSGEVVDSKTGVVPKESIVSWVESHLS